MKNQDIIEEKLILQEACFSHAKKIIESRQTLIPFGAFLNMQNEIIIEDPVFNTVVQQDRIEQLSNKLTRLTYVNRIKAWAICFDGILNKSNIKDAICIEMHEASQESITNLYYPYQWDEHKVIFSEPIFEKE